MCRRFHGYVLTADTENLYLPHTVLVLLILHTSYILLFRFLAVIYPLKQIARKKKSSIIVAIVIIWICAISLSVPVGKYTITVSFVVPVMKNGNITAEKVTDMFFYICVDFKRSEPHLVYLITIVFQGWGNGGKLYVMEEFAQSWGFRIQNFLNVWY